MKISVKLLLILLAFPLLLAAGCQSSKIPAHKKNELVILYKDQNARVKWEMKIDSLFALVGPKTKITKKECSNCLGLGILLTGDKLDRLLREILNGHGELIRTSDNRNPSGATGDTTVVISLNYLTEVFDPKPNPNLPGKFSTFGKNEFSGKEIIVGVLDSGIDADYFPNDFLWNYPENQDCYPNEKFGWNFVNGTSDISDHTPHKHGTLVNAFILEQFLRVGVNRPKLLNVKVLNENNSGTVFDMICGILYAKEKGAKIINTSMGYYDNQSYLELTDGKDPVLYLLHKEHLAPDGILLVTAAGNMEDNEVVTGGRNPRDLTQNRFYPAVLSDTESKSRNSVITATTINLDLNQPSPRQNHSLRHVDVGVVADFEEGDFFRFYFPFTEESDQNRPSATGSSFANAIVSGLIGARFDFNLPYLIQSKPKYEWSDSLIEQGIFQESTNGMTSQNFRNIENQNGRTNRPISDYIWKGRYLKRR